MLVNTRGFIEAVAKRESIDTVPSLAGDDAPAVTVTGCLAERYGTEPRCQPARGACGSRLRRLSLRSRRLGCAVMREDVPAPVPTDLPPDFVAAESGCKIGRQIGSRAGMQVQGRRRTDQQASRTKQPSGTPHPSYQRWPRSNWVRRIEVLRAILRFRGSFVSRTPSRSSPKWERCCHRSASEVTGLRELHVLWKRPGDMRLLESLLPDLAAGHRCRTHSLVLSSALPRCA